MGNSGEVGDMGSFASTKLQRVRVTTICIIAKAVGVNDIS